MNASENEIERAEVWLTRVRHPNGSIALMWGDAGVVKGLFPNGYILDGGQSEDDRGVVGYWYNASGKRGEETIPDFTATVRKLYPEAKTVKGPLIEVLDIEDWYSLDADPDFLEANKLGLSEWLEDEHAFWGDGKARKQSEKGSPRNADEQQFTAVTRLHHQPFGPTTYSEHLHFRRLEDYERAKALLMAEAA